MLIVGELFFGNFAPLVHGAVFSQLFQGEQVGARLHHAAGDHHRGDVNAANGHKQGGVRIYRSWR